METKELKITVPEGFEIDKDKSTFEKIVFKKKENTIPRSWEEYLCSGNHPSKLWYINPTYKSTGGIGSTEGDVKDFDLNKSCCLMSAYLPSKEFAGAFLIMMQLVSLRQAWIHRWSIDNGLTKDWEPDWKESSQKYGILTDMNNITVGIYYYTSISLSFPTKDMAEDFINCFKDLLEIAKPLI